MKIIPIAMSADEIMEKLSNTSQENKEKKIIKQKPKIICQEIIKQPIKIKVKKAGTDSKKESPDKRIKRYKKIMMKEEQKPRKMLKNIFYPTEKENIPSQSEIKEKEFRREDVMKKLMKVKTKKKKKEIVKQQEHRVLKEELNKKVKLELSRLS